VAVRDENADDLSFPDESGRWIQLVLPSRLEMLAVLDGLVQAITAQMEFPEESAIEIATSVIEAGTNAIQHGHGNNEKLQVLFRFYLGENALEVWVRDSGPGFDVQTVTQLDPTRPEDILKARGRGIYIMRATMDQVDFDVRPGVGTLVHLLKALPRGNGSRARAD
jgi:serine/threonine-protein kinase RsbW